MFDKWLKIPAHYYLNITALVILAVGICLHNTLMSIGTIWIISNWLIEAKFKLYWKNFCETPAVWFLVLILLLGGLSLLWSDDLNYGLSDLARKSPFFVIPFVLGTAKPLEKKVRYFILYVFLFTLLLTSGINYYRYNYVLENTVDIREMSYFISHVRYSILIIIGVSVCIYLFIEKKKFRILWPLFGVWLVYYAIKSQTVTAYVLLVLLFLLTIIFVINALKVLRHRVIASLVFIAILLISKYYVEYTLAELQGPAQTSFDDLEKTSANGRKYFHDQDARERENGNLIWIYVQVDELETEWNRRSLIAYDSLDNTGQPMFGTLLRYMTSKNMRKDSVGVWSLTEAEIKLIESGCTSIAMNSGIRAKIQEFIIEWDLYQHGGNPNGHSILQRVEHLKIAWELAKSNWLFGVGIGDVNQAFLNEYDTQNSLLELEQRHRSHNQFLTLWIGLGIIGLCFFVAMLLLPLIEVEAKDYFFWSILIALLVSLFFQDMLETQAGVCIFGLFYSLMAFTDTSSSKVLGK